MMWVERSQTIGGTIGFAAAYVGIVVGAATQSVFITITSAGIAAATVTGMLFLEIRYGEKVTHAPQTPPILPTQAHGDRDVPR